MKLYALIVGVMFLSCGCGDVVQSDIQVAKQHAGSDMNTTAIYIVMDGSGSMEDKVQDGNTFSPKWDIAKRSLIQLGNILDTYLKSNPSKKILTGIVLFEKNEITSFDFGIITNNVTEVYKKWTNEVNSPCGGTPIGTAITKASNCFANDQVNSKHIIVITDGVNNVGYGAYTAVTRLNKGANVHFIAFDVDASVFDDVKKIGCGVVNATNATDLQKRVNTIVKNDILLEKED